VKISSHLKRGMTINIVSYRMSNITTKLSDSKVD